MSTLEARLLEQITETCKHPFGSIERQEGLTELVQLITRSRKLWQENVPHYGDALQRTWLFFCRNLCEATSGEKYNPDRGSVITWLNTYLKWELHRFRTQDYQQQARTAPTIQTASGERLDPIDLVESPPDVPPILEITRQWAVTDLDGELRQTHVKGHPAVSCQLLILRRLPPETSWQELSEEFQLPISTLNSFYQRQCVPRLRKFGESQGYL